MDELNKIAPELSKLKKKNPYGVPVGYFDEFPARLRARLDAEEDAAPRKTRFIQLIKPAVGLAASFILIFMLVYWPLKTFTPKQLTQNNTETELTDNDYFSVLERMDEDSFFALLNEPAEEIEFTDEDLLAYVSANISEYEIYVDTNFQ